MEISQLSEPIYSICHYIEHSQFITTLFSAVNCHQTSFWMRQIGSVQVSSIQILNENWDAHDCAIKIIVSNRLACEFIPFCRSVKAFKNVSLQHFFCEGFSWKLEHLTFFLVSLGSSLYSIMNSTVSELECGIFSPYIYSSITTLWSS
jgi:hypothetical protein